MMLFKRVKFINPFGFKTFSENLYFGPLMLNQLFLILFLEKTSVFFPNRLSAIGVACSNNADETLRQIYRRCKDFHYGQNMTLKNVNTEIF